MLRSKNYGRIDEVKVEQFHEKSRDFKRIFRHRFVDFIVRIPAIKEFYWLNQMNPVRKFLQLRQHPTFQCKVKEY